MTDVAAERAVSNLFMHDWLRLGWFTSIQLAHLLDRNLHYFERFPKCDHGVSRLVIRVALFGRWDNSVRGVYNSAEWLSGRRTMLQWWADYLEAQESGPAVGTCLLPDRQKNMT
jgi:hypothetical protein